MHITSLVQVLTFLEPVGCAGALMLMHRRNQIRQFGFLSGYLFVRLVAVSTLVPILAMGNHLFSFKVAYPIYFYGYWTCYAVEAVLGFGIIYSIYNLAMAPLKGLQRLGRLMFRWAAGIAVALALTTAFGPHVTSVRFVTRAITQIQETQSVLTLCMLLFVCLAIQPMGLSHRSKIFGISLGLGFIATADLIGSAWLAQIKSMTSIYNTMNGVAVLCMLGIWSAYFAIPEPKRQMIVLPTTSPFLRWNQISLALGDEPGYVALGDITPEMFAPAEVEVMRRASIKMSEALTG